MASSRKSKRSSGASPYDGVATTLKSLVKAGDRLVVGLSGGIDSVVLLDMLARLAPRLRFELAAVHVNHQLSPNAARWAKFCRALCRARGIPLQVTKVAVKRGDSVEAAARDARYSVFAKQCADYVALAHNQDDQAETLLMRGEPLVRSVGRDLRTPVRVFVAGGFAILAAIRRCRYDVWSQRPTVGPLTKLKLLAGAWWRG